VNAAVYAINWTNIQQTINLPTCGFNFTANVGDAKIYGSEFEFKARVSPSLTLGLNAGTTHAYLSSISTVGSGIASVGESVLNVPKYTITPSADYDARINDALSLFVRADFPYTGRSRAYFDSSGLPNLFNPAYGILNLNVGVAMQRLSLGLYAKNLLGSTTIIQFPSVNTVQEAYAVRPLTIGATVDMKF
jgi:outer membrane receptor protein involved in Fe transport